MLLSIIFSNVKIHGKSVVQYLETFKQRIEDIQNSRVRTFSHTNIPNFSSTGTVLNLSLGYDTLMTFFIVIFLLLCHLLTAFAQRMFYNDPTSVNHWGTRLICHIGSMSYQLFSYLLIPMFFYGTNKKMRKSVFDHFGISRLFGILKEKKDSISTKFQLHNE